MDWHLTNRADPRAALIADRHYNRQHIGSRQFTPPGRVLVLVTADYKALWCSSAPYAEYVKHAWAGAWMCTCFRNEGAGLSSALIIEALAATRWVWGEPPPLGMVTFVNTAKLHKWRWDKRQGCAVPVPLDQMVAGLCYLEAGFTQIGWTEGGLVALQLRPAAMPDPAPPQGAQLRLLDEVA